ncbi:MAG TPA: AAA family ATPase [Thermoanaerobaculia bacterium]|jgi:hypothetical protein|nr:AAA family ATPase [Thermoanaerobaculia bacterium]
MTTHAFVVVSGIPASGKSVLGRQLSSALKLPLLDKDDFLDRLLSGEPEVDVARRRALSRESDKHFQEAALLTDAAVLVSFWHLPGMPADSGTPMAWLAESTRRLVHIHCVCRASVAAERFLTRERHPGHGDRQRSHRDVVADFQRLADLGGPPVPGILQVDTAQQVDVDSLVAAIQARLSAA